MVDKHPEWAGKVRLIGISDHDVDELQEKMADKMMNAVELYHVSDQIMSCSYEMKGFPHICLIDTEGFIAFAGYPSEREDIEHDISTLLAGDKLTGKGTLDLGWDRADCASDD